MFCHKCGNKLDKDSKFCGKCGNTTTKESMSEQAPINDSNTNEQVEHKTLPTIKCGNCGYIGAGEPARSLAGKILAWICVVFAPIITIVYFVATHKWRCPKCKSTFLGVKNEHGVFVGQTGGASRIVTIFICILVGVAIMGILASVVLASLNSARQKGADASIKANLANARAQAELYYDKNADSYEGVCTSTDGVLEMKSNASESSGSNVVCNDVTKSWAMSSPLKSIPDNSWCVDSTGTNKEISGGIGNQNSCSGNYSSDTTDASNAPALTGAQVCARDLPNSTWDGKSYTSDGSYECSCKKGYEPNTAGNACITPDQSCNSQFPNTHFVGNNTCECKTGYTWNSSQTSCY